MIIIRLQGIFSEWILRNSLQFPSACPFSPTSGPVYLSLCVQMLSKNGVVNWNFTIEDNQIGVPLKLSNRNLPGRILYFFLLAKISNDCPRKYSKTATFIEWVLMDFSSLFCLLDTLGTFLLTNWLMSRILCVGILQNFGGVGFSFSSMKLNVRVENVIWSF